MRRSVLMWITNNFSKEMQGGYSKLDGTDWYYEAQFWSEMPDLNLAVRQSVMNLTRS